RPWASDCSQKMPAVHSVIPPSCDPVGRRRPGRRLLPFTCLFIITILLLRAVGAEPYGVPTGSMAPALVGNHRAATCPRCGYPVTVGYREDHRRSALTAHCPSCGCDDLSGDR